MDTDVLELVEGETIEDAQEACLYRTGFAPGRVAPCERLGEFLWLFKCCSDGTTLCHEHKNRTARLFNLMNANHGAITCKVHGRVPYKPSESYIIVPL